MSGLSIDDLELDRTRYAAIRKAERQRIMAVRQRRRVQVGPHMAIAFENLDTVRFQVQEMVYVEAITTAAGIGEEIAAYQRLLPGNRSLMATMLLEFADVSTVDAELDALKGIQHMVQLRIGDTGVTGEDVPPPDDVLTDQTFTVHFLRFHLTEEQAAALADLRVPVRMSVEHPNYRADVEVAAQTRAELLADLAA